MAKFFKSVISLGFMVVAASISLGCSAKKSETSQGQNSSANRIVPGFTDTSNLPSVPSANDLSDLCGTDSSSVIFGPFGPFGRSCSELKANITSLGFLGYEGVSDEVLQSAPSFSASVGDTLTFSFREQLQTFGTNSVSGGHLVLSFWVSGHAGSSLADCEFPMPTSVLNDTLRHTDSSLSTSVFATSLPAGTSPYSYKTPDITFSLQVPECARGRNIDLLVFRYEDMQSGVSSYNSDWPVSGAVLSVNP